MQIITPTPTTFEAPKIVSSVTDGTATGAQRKASQTFGGIGTIGGVHGVVSAGTQHGEAPMPGTYETYREMRQDPTIAIARAAAQIPIKGAAWTYVAGRENVGDDMIATVREAIEPLRSRFMSDAMFGIDYGWQSWEIVWAAKGRAIVPVALKSLLPDITTIEINPDTGSLVGVSQINKGQRVVLEGPKRVVWSHDREAQNWYGRSRFENIRTTAWQTWRMLQKRIDTYTAKGAGVIFVLEYPGEGSWRDERGNIVSSDEAAKRVIHTISQMGSVAVPRVIQPGLERMIQNTTNPQALMQWQMRFIEAASGHGSEMLDMCRYYDAQKLRGYFVPERATSEGTHGTLAEAEAHGDLLVAMSIDTLNDILDSAVNPQIVDAILEINYGPDARGAVRVEAAPDTSTQRLYANEILKAIVTNPTNLDLAMRILDLDAMIDGAGLPKMKQIIDTDPTADPAANSPLSRAWRMFAQSVGSI